MQQVYKVASSPLDATSHLNHLAHEIPDVVQMEKEEASRASRSIRSTSMQLAKAEAGKLTSGGGLLAPDISVVGYLGDFVLETTRDKHAR